MCDRILDMVWNGGSAVDVSQRGLERTFAHEQVPQLQEPSVLIKENAEKVAEAYGNYAVFLRDELREAILDTLNELNDKLEKLGILDLDARYAQYELLMLTTVDRLLVDEDMSHFATVNAGEDSNATFVVKADIKDWVLNMTNQRGDSIGAFIPLSATWKFEFNGIRLTVDYIDTTTGERRKVHTGLDFHMRSPKYNAAKGRSTPQGALDVTGGYLSQVVTHRLSMDYHLSQYLDGILDSGMLREIKEGRIKAVKDWLLGNKSNVPREVLH